MPQAIHKKKGCAEMRYTRVAPVLALLKTNAQKYGRA
jgi:hypothetical protein